MAGFIAFMLFVTLVALLVWASFRLGQEAEQHELEIEQCELDAGWTALEQARRVNDVFFHARDAMRRVEDDAQRRR